LLAGGKRSVAVLEVYTQSSVKETGSDTSAAHASSQPLDRLQVAAAYFYVCALFAGGVLWGLDAFSPTSADILKNVTYSLIGVAGGVIAVALNVRR
jgi:hypothetical protein